jgi:Tol biopolymer transport system component
VRLPAWKAGRASTNTIDVQRAIPLLVTIALGLVPAAASAQASRVSVGAGGEQATGESGAAAPSADGRFVAFASDAPDLVPGDTNGVADVFVRDRVTGTTWRVSVTTGGAQAGGISGAPSISASGRIVAFVSRAQDLVPGDPNGAGIDVFVHDRQTGRTTRLSARRETAAQRAWISFDPAVSGNGAHVAFSAERLAAGDDGEMHEAGPRRVYVHALHGGAISRVSVSSRERAAKGESGAPAISDDARYVAFESTAANLVPGDTNGKQDIFVRDRRRGTTQRASLSSSERQARYPSYEPAISATGRHVAFTTRAHNLAAGDLDGATDIYVRDRRKGTIRRASRGSAGASMTGWATAPSISADGDLVAFQLSATDLVADGDGPVGRVYVRKRSNRATWEARTLAGAPAERSGFPALSADGRVVAFTSGATDLVAGDTNGRPDVFAAGPLR